VPGRLARSPGTVSRGSLTASRIRFEGRCVSAWSISAGGFHPFFLIASMAPRAPSEVAENAMYLPSMRSVGWTPGEPIFSDESPGTNSM
jgi:hypothetical protein